MAVNHGMSISTLLDFKSLKSIDAKYVDVRDVISSSTSLALIFEEGDWTVRRRVPYVHSPDRFDGVTCFVNNVPADATVDSLRSHFERYGPVALVRLPRLHAPKWKPAASTPRPHKGYAFIVYEDVHGMYAAVAGHLQPSSASSAGRPMTVVPKSVWLARKGEKRDGKARSEGQAQVEGTETSGVLVRLDGISSRMPFSALRTACRTVGRVQYLHCPTVHGSGVYDPQVEGGRRQRSRKQGAARALARASADSGGGNDSGQEGSTDGHEGDDEGSESGVEPARKKLKLNTDGQGDGALGSAPSTEQTTHAVVRYMTSTEAAAAVAFFNGGWLTGGGGGAGVSLQMSSAVVVPFPLRGSSIRAALVAPGSDEDINFWAALKHRPAGGTGEPDKQLAAPQPQSSPRAGRKRRRQ